MAHLNDAELHDPFPDIHALFCHYNDLYFYGALGACCVRWSSKRMTLCAGVCHCMKMGGCEIRLSEPLLKFCSATDVKNTLLHEMIHAYLFLKNGKNDHDDHGPSFQRMMKIINESSMTDHQRPVEGYHVTIYHNFVDEVNNYRTHHWKCQICGDTIKRAMNREPSASDCRVKVVAINELCNDSHCHWHQHQRTCGGSYIKIAEPPDYRDKRKKKSSTDTNICESTRSKVTMKGYKSVKAKDTKKDKAVTLQSGHASSLENFFPKLRKEEEGSKRDNYSMIFLDDNSDDDEESGRLKRRKNSEHQSQELQSLSLKSTPSGKTDQLKVAGSCSYENHYDVIIKWKNWYAFETEDIDGEPLVNRRQEKRRRESMLKPINEQLAIGTDTSSVEHINCFKSKAKQDAKSIIKPTTTKWSANHENSQQVLSSETDSPMLVSNDQVFSFISNCESPDAGNGATSVSSGNQASSSFSGTDSWNCLHQEETHAANLVPCERASSDIINGLPKFSNGQCNRICMDTDNEDLLCFNGQHKVCKFVNQVEPEHACDKGDCSTKNFDMEKQAKISTKKMSIILDDSKEEQIHRASSQIAQPEGEGMSAACPICGKTFGGDIHEGKFNVQFNIHVDKCIVSQGWTF